MAELFRLLPGRNELVQDVLHRQGENCTCNTDPNITYVFNTVPICNISLFPTWVLAVVIGVVGGLKLLQLGPALLGTLVYPVTFFMYAAMITSGFLMHSVLLVECGAAPVTQVYVYLAFTDSSLTACIGISFVFDGLVDLRLMSERATCSKLVMIGTYAVLFILNFGNFINVWIIYRGSILFGCATYLLCQALLLVHMKNPTHPLLYLMAAGLAGGVSFVLFTEFLCLLCTRLGAWSIEGLWYYGSDMAMFFILMYALVTRKRLPANINSTTTVKPPIKSTDTNKPFKDGNGLIADGMKKCSTAS